MVVVRTRRRAHMAVGVLFSSRAYSETITCWGGVHSAHCGSKAQESVLWIKAMQQMAAVKCCKYRQA